MCDLFRNILLKFMNEESVARLEQKQLIQIDVENFKNYCKLKNLDVGIGTLKAISDLNEIESKDVRMAIRGCLVKLAKSLQGSLPFSNTLLKDLQVLHPSMREQDSQSAIRRLCVGMTPLNLDDIGIDRLLCEWKAYRFDVSTDKICKEFLSGVKKIDDFWNEVFSLKDVDSGRNKYSYLPYFVKNCLSLSHGNADVERGFSLNNSIVIECRTNLSESTIIGIRNVKDAVRRYGDIFSVPITGQLLQSVTKSHAAYMEEKEALKKAKEDEKQKKALEEKLRIKADEVKKLKLKKEQRIGEINATIADLQEDLASANKCVSEGNERLQSALKRKNFNDMRISSTIIEAGTNNIKKITKELSIAQQKLNIIKSK